MTSNNPWFNPHDDAPHPAAAGTPLYDQLAAARPADLASTPHDGDAPAGDAAPMAIDAAAVLTLFARIKTIEESNGGWPADVVDVLTVWFDEFGIDVEADSAAAARALRVPAHLASALTAPYRRDGEFVVHLRTENSDAAVYVRSYLSELVSALGERTSAAVFDHTGDQISHFIHPDDEPGTQ
jgi:hypothetical protein